MASFIRWNQGQEEEPSAELSMPTGGYFRSWGGGGAIIIMFLTTVTNVD